MSGKPFWENVRKELGNVPSRINKDGESPEEECSVLVQGHLGEAGRRSGLSSDAAHWSSGWQCWTGVLSKSCCPVEDRSVEDSWEGISAASRLSSNNSWEWVITNDASPWAWSFAWNHFTLNLHLVIWPKRPSPDPGWCQHCARGPEPRAKSISFPYKLANLERLW